MHRSAPRPRCHPAGNGGARPRYAGQAGHDVGGQDVRAGDGIDLVGNISFDRIALGCPAGRGGIGIGDRIVISKGHHAFRGRCGIRDTDRAGTDGDVGPDLDAAERTGRSSRERIAVGVADRAVADADVRSGGQFSLLPVECALQVGDFRDGVRVREVRNLRFCVRVREVRNLRLGVRMRTGRLASESGGNGLFSRESYSRVSSS